MVYGGNEYALSVAVSEFADTLLSLSAKGIVEAVVSGTEEQTCENRLLNVCQTCFDLENGYDADYAVEIIRIVEEEQYDIIVFKELGDLERDAVEMNLLNFGYSVEECGEHYTVLYKNEIFGAFGCVSDESGAVMTVKMRVKGERYDRKLVCELSDSSVTVSDDGVRGVLISDGAASVDAMTYVAGVTVSAGGAKVFREVWATPCLSISAPHTEIAYGNGYRAMFYSVKFNTRLARGYFELQDSVK